MPALSTLLIVINPPSPSPDFSLLSARINAVPGAQRRVAAISANGPPHVLTSGHLNIFISDANAAALANKERQKPAEPR